ncbi:MAG: polyphosphate kinase 2 [Campylobacterales bacterium]|nr:polyphosphate kinase 2 [Campylobacterales bacterium]
MILQSVCYSEELPEYTVHSSKVFNGNGKIRGKFYEKEALKLQYELVKLQKWVIDNQKRLLVIIEGMDGAGKSTTIKEFTMNLNPREARTVALPKPDSREAGQWYFERHMKQLPNAGEIVFFDRSWYNRAGIEQVFGFCTPQQHKHFYNQVNKVEEMLVDDGIMLFKFYLNISYETQSRRLKDREKDPLKNWKLSELDYKSHEAYGEYVVLRDKMFAKSGTAFAPWCEVNADDKKRARLNAVKYLLCNIDYEGKDKDAILGIDKKIVKIHNKGQSNE